jgi:TolB-like protein/tetratricopeptide (TPR) repeat protein
MSQYSTNQAESGSNVFVSCASQDAAVANSIVESLEAHGIKCWMAPRDVKPGAQYADAIVRAINEARSVVLVMSGSAVASSHVGKEIERASSKRKPIIAFRVDAAPLNHALEYFLSESQWIDVKALGMPAALARLKEAVGQGGATSSQTITAGKRAVGTKTGIAVAAVVVIAVGLGFYFWKSNHGAAQAPAVTAITDKSIAVLPFVDMSEKKDQEYFGDGMAEEVINLLAKVPDLRVPARTSSFYFKSKSTKVPEIARELGVAQVLEGSIRRSGDRIRVTAQLVRADTGYHLWSETYDRPVDDVFKVQDEIANAVVQALQISLMGGPLTRQKGGTQNLEAYQLYLRGLSENLMNSKAGFEGAREHLQRATELDPDFALAWSALGFTTYSLALLRALPTTEGFEGARQLAQHALRLSPELAEGYYLLGYVHRTYDWDWSAAQVEVDHALALDPNHPRALQLSGQLAATLGRYDEADRKLRAALARDPLNNYFHYNLATTLYRAGRLDEADAEYRKLLAFAPGFSWTRKYLAKTLLVEGKPEAALAMAQQEVDQADRADILPMMLLAVGRRAESDEALKVLIEKYANGDAYFVAMNYAYRGDLELALQWLDRAYRQKEIRFVEIVGEHLFKNLANDPRYKAFLQKMKLPSD